MFKVVGSVFNFLQLIFTGTVTLTNGTIKRMNNIFYYQWDGIGAAPVQASKNSLVTTAVTGFKAVVIAALLAALNNRWTSIGIFSRWLDNYTDPSTLVPGAGTFVTAGAIAGDSLPLDNHVTYRKLTGLAGRNFHGDWKFAPISESDTTGDELTNPGVNGPPPTGVANWKLGGGVAGNALGTQLTLSISDGVNTMKPVLISQRLSDLAYKPVRTVAGAAITGVALNLATGRMKKRQEKQTKTV